MSRSAIARVALSCVLVAFAFGCGPSPSVQGAARAVHPVKVGELRILERRVNLMEPVMVGFNGGDVGITVATRGREGVSVAVDPTSLEARTTTPFEYGPHRRRAHAPCHERDATVVTLAGGASLAIWNDEATSRLVAHYSGGGGPIAITPEDVAVIGGPAAVTVDGHHVVVTFFGGDEKGFHLLATSLDVTP